MESFAFSSYEKPLSASPNISNQCLGTHSEVHAPSNLSNVGHSSLAQEAGHALYQSLSLPGSDTATLSALSHSAQQISPMLQMIMRLPGQLGLFNAFFEALQSFIAPHLDFFGQFDPAFLGLHNVSSLPAENFGEHIVVDSALLPSHAHIFDNLGNESFSLRTHFQEDDLLSTPLTVSATPELTGPSVTNAHLVGASTTDATTQGQLAGPSLKSAVNPTPHLADSHRLFADKLFERNSTASSSQSIPASTSTSVSAITSYSQSSISPNLSSSDISNTLGPSGAVSNELGAKHLLDTSGNELNSAKAEGTNQTISTSKTSLEKLDSQANGDNHGQVLVGLKAKELTLGQALHLQRSLEGHGIAISPPHDIAMRPSHSTASSLPHQEAVKLATDSSANDLAQHGQNHSKFLARRSLNDLATPKTDKIVPVAYRQDIVASASPPRANCAALPDAAASATQVATVGSTYTIRAGDCLWNIAKNHLNNVLRWQEIYHLNGDKLGVNPDLIHPGTQIDLPSVGHIQVIASQAVDHSPYIVHQGDNLWDIAQNHLGSGTRWSEIYRLNTDVIGTNPRLILPGQELKLPGADACDKSALIANAAPITNSLPNQSVSTQQVISDLPSTGSTALSQQGSISSATASTTVAQATVVPSHGHMLSGPGGAEAATLTQRQSSANASIVSPSLAPDFSFLRERR